ncbi:MAG: glycoside hydrolase family 65 protein, partial [Bacilli bacterium]|nr:glycoside hydrolase family 65 protein [Bacilli bacterium]
MNHFFVDDFEKAFSLDYDYAIQNNKESILTIGNGRYGLRGTFEEKLPYENRGFFRSGFYLCQEGKSEDLLCLPDISEIRLVLNGEFFHISRGNFKKHERFIDLDSHELIRRCIWISPTGKSYDITFKRFFSFANPDLFYQEVVVGSDTEDVEILIETGVNGGGSGSKKSDVFTFESRVIDKSIMQVHVAYGLPDSQSLTFTQGLKLDNRWLSGDFNVKNSALVGSYRSFARKASRLSVTKVTLISDNSLSIQEAHGQFSRCEEYAGHIQKHQDSLHRNVRLPLELLNRDADINQKIKASLHHIWILTPYHDEMSIGAKGLSGEGYNGHVFWDTEIFMFPYYLFTDPFIAKKLLLYRYNRLDQSRSNAKSRGYQGAMVAWESALSGIDQTPEFSAINIHTGKRTLVHSGKKELHVTVDVMFAIIMYYLATEDDEFMQKYGVEMLEEYTRFWLSKCKMTNRGLEILDVIGPDEYTEHINNNFYTNFMVKKALKMAAIHFRDQILAEEALKASELIYLPVIERSVIPQDDTFLHKKEIDIYAYRENAGSQDILKDFSREQVNELQVLKQADSILLFELFPDDFPDEVVSATYHYYEKRTIHDSSLSKSTHAIVGFDIKDQELATKYFRESLDVDFSDYSHSSTGIHAASMFRPFLILFRGVLGIRIMADGILKIDPKRQFLVPEFHLTF